MMKVEDGPGKGSKKKKVKDSKNPLLATMAANNAREVVNMLVPCR